MKDIKDLEKSLYHIEMVYYLSKLLMDLLMLIRMTYNL